MVLFIKISTILLLRINILNSKKTVCQIFMLNIVYEQLLLLIYLKTKPQKSVLYYFYNDCKEHDAFEN